MEERVLGYGVIGTGVYCDHYFGTLGPVFKNLRPVGCADLNTEAAKAAAARWNVPKVYTTEEMLADPEVDIVVILTNPASHYSLTMAALKAGKHVYCEKPLADSFEQANEIVEFAAEKGLFVGSAPDTFLTPEFQTVRKLLDEGAIGKVINVTANYVGPGADLWHPNAGYLYKKGVGPALDMGPYFITSLVTLLGPIESIFCFANRGWDVRKIWDKDVEVEVNTNYCAVLKFRNGTVGNLNLTYDEWKSSLPGMELYGTEGVLFAPEHASEPSTDLRAWASLPKSRPSPRGWATSAAQACRIWRKPLSRDASRESAEISAATSPKQSTRSISASKPACPIR